MKFAKKIKIKLTVKDNQFLKEQVLYLQRACEFSTVNEKNPWDTEETELVSLIDSDEFIITLNPVTHHNGELAIVNGEFQYMVGLTFKRTSMNGVFHKSYAPYVLFTPSEVFRLVFPNVKFNTESLPYSISPTVDDDIIPILSMAFGLKHEEKFKYEII